MGTEGTSVLGFQEIDETQVAVVGGKGAHLGELSRIDGIRVPPGFCVTTDAFRRIMAEAPSIDDRLDRLSRLDPDDREGIRTLSAEIRRTLEGIAIPDDLAAAITARARPSRRASRLRRPVERDGGGPADGLLRGPAGHVPERRGAGRDPPARQPVLGLAVHRASRDLPPAERLRPPERPHGRRRAADGLPARGRHPLHGGPRHVQPQGRLGGGRLRPRRGPGLRPGERRSSTRCGTARSSTGRWPPSGSPSTPRRPAGRRNETIEPERQEQPALTDAQVIRLAQLGRRIEAHFGRPQDIEWCLADDGFQIVQSRPITTLFPIPAAGDEENHVYVSVGHQQMMTDPMKPLGLSLFQLTAGPPMHEAGGQAVRRRHPAPGFADEPRRSPGGHGQVRSADQGRAARPSSNAATSSRRSRTRVPAGRRPAAHQPRSRPIRPSSPS